LEASTVSVVSPPSWLMGSDPSGFSTVMMRSLPVALAVGLAGVHLMLNLNVAALVS
jgi:hypothetical protein